MLEHFVKGYAPSFHQCKRKDELIRVAQWRPYLNKPYNLANLNERLNGLKV